MTTAERKVNRKARRGVVVSSVNDKTVIVAVSRAARHRLYRKVIRQTKRYAVHDPDNRASVGDLVTIEETRPISKTKRWRLAAVLTEREVAEVAPEAIDSALVDEVQRTAARAAAEGGGAAPDAAAPPEDPSAIGDEDAAGEAAGDAETVADDAPEAGVAETEAAASAETEAAETEAATSAEAEAAGDAETGTDAAPEAGVAETEAAAGAETEAVADAAGDEGEAADGGGERAQP